MHAFKDDEINSRQKPPVINASSHTGLLTLHASLSRRLKKANKRIRLTHTLARTKIHLTRFTPRRPRADSELNTVSTTKLPLPITVDKMTIIPISVRTHLRMVQTDAIRALHPSGATLNSICASAASCPFLPFNQSQPQGILS